MKIIKKLSEMINEELEGAEHYVKCAIKYKDEHPALAKAMYDISMDEMRHVTMLHGEVVEIIENYRKEAGEPPVAMMAVYEYLHEKQIDKANAVRVCQNQYRGTL